MVLASALIAEPRQQPMDKIDALDWHDSKRKTAMTDGSTLTIYVTDRTSMESGAVRLEVGFSPRFDCAPLLSFGVSPPVADLFDAHLSAVAAARPDTSGAVALSVSLDGQAIEWPVVVDTSGDERVAWLHASERARSAVRVGLNRGSLIELSLGDSEGATYRFSMAGSRRALAVTQALCENHVPVAWP